MFKSVVMLSLLVSVQSFALSLDVKGQSLNPEVVKFLEKKLVACTLDIGNEVMTIENVQVVADRVDNGITDLYYTIDLSYDAVRNDVISNEITVVVVDSDFHNYRDYSERLSLTVTKDRNNFCTK